MYVMFIEFDVIALIENIKNAAQANAGSRKMNHII